MARWDDDQEQTLDSILSVKSNFDRSDASVNTSDARRFVDEAGPCQLARMHGSWVHDQLGQGVVPLVDSFPSLKASLFTTYYRLYDDNRVPERQDVVDILNSAAVPYMDGVVTERLQADILRKVRCREAFLEHLEVSTLSDLRTAAGE